jgi:hypothetical protein
VLAVTLLAGGLSGCADRTGRRAAPATSATGAQQAATVPAAGAAGRPTGVPPVTVQQVEQASEQAEGFLTAAEADLARD